MSDHWNEVCDAGGCIDTHGHLSMLKVKGIPGEKHLARLFEMGFGGIIDIGIEADDLSRRIRAFTRFDRVRFSAGIWPSKTAITGRKQLVPVLEGQIKAAPRNQVIAIGECGLDCHHNKPGSGADPAGEGELLEMQLDLAQRLELPIIIHSREAPEETRDILAKYPKARGVIHCFSYSPLEARYFLDLGYYLSFAGTLTYKNAQGLREALTFTPLDRILLETDSPFLAPLPFRGKPAHPGMVVETYKLAATLLNRDLGEIKNTIAQNVAALFGITF